MEKQAMLSVKEKLESLGYKLSDCGDNWRTSALYRKGSNPTSLLIYKDTGVWTDYGGDNQAHPFEELVKLSGGEVGDFTVKKLEVTEEEESDEVERIFPDEMLSRLMPHYNIYTNKGISINILKRLKSGLAMQGKMFQRYVFPILNSEGKIIGFSGRDVGIGGNRPKWKHIGKKRNWIYPLYFKDELSEQFVLNAIRRTKEILDFKVQFINNFSNNFYNIHCNFYKSFYSNNFKLFYMRHSCFKNN